jgi:hypothetical protein
MGFGGRGHAMAWHSRRFRSISYLGEAANLAPHTPHILAWLRLESNNLNVFFFCFFRVKLKMVCGGNQKYQKRCLCLFWVKTLHSEMQIWIAIWNKNMFTETKVNCFCTNQLKTFKRFWRFQNWHWHLTHQHD